MVSGIRGKLIGIFVLIKIVPLVVLAWFAFNEVSKLGQTVAVETDAIAAGMRTTMQAVGDQAAADSIYALDRRAQESLERLTVERAQAVADFLYGRDGDVRLAADLEPSEAAYRSFLSHGWRAVVEPLPRKLDAEGAAWVPAVEAEPDRRAVAPGSPENEKDFHYRPPQRTGRLVPKPLYLEMTLVGLDGREQLKVTTSPLMNPQLRDVSRRENTFVKAETYFDQIRRLKPGEIFVSDVIGAYVPSPIVGTFTPARAQTAGIPFEPEKYAFAGEENPVGRRFQGLVRWATPVVRDGAVAGWVTLALDHTHLMEFTDHMMPTDDRYSDISDAGAGNYAFMWDARSRNISHPRDYFIHGYDPDTGKLVPPFLDAETYAKWQASGQEWEAFAATYPRFHNQSMHNKPAVELIKQGRIPLLCEYVNTAPQCLGWHNLTEHGGSGSFLIYWSGIWKLTTAAAIPYFTGPYGTSPRGFGYITIGANVDVFHRPATESKQRIDGLVAAQGEHVKQQQADLQASIVERLGATAAGLGYQTVAMIAIVILIAIWMANVLTRRITRMIGGLQRFQEGELDHRLPVQSQDEMGQLAASFNVMADRLAAMLRSSQEHYRLLAQNVQDVVWIVSPPGVVLHVSPSVQRLLGHTAQEVIATPYQGLFTEASWPTVHGAVGRLLASGGQASERLEVEQPVKAGGSVWTECVLSTLYDDAGALLGVLGVSRDVTERRQAAESLRAAKERAEENYRQLEAARQSLVQAEKLASLGGLVAGVAHEINTPVGITVTSASHLRRETEQLKRLYETEELSPTDLEAYIADATDATDLLVSNANRAAELIQSFKKVAVDQSSGERRRFRLAEYINEVLLSLRPRLRGTSHTVTIDCPEDLEVDGYPGALSQVLTNLVMNALVHAFDPGQAGQIRIAAALRDGRVALSFADDGKGIAADILPKVFDPFFTTRRGSGGSGLGLNIAYTVVKGTLKGDIGVASVLGAGTTFTVDFPQTVPAAEPAVPA